MAAVGGAAESLLGSSTGDGAGWIRGREGLVAGA